MPGSYHIIYPFTDTRSQRFSALCDEVLERNKVDYCNVGIANPNWDYDWCHACVQAAEWTDEAKRLWEAKGIRLDRSE